MALLWYCDTNFLGSGTLLLLANFCQVLPILASVDVSVLFLILQFSGSLLKYSSAVALSDGASPSLS